MTDRTAAVCLSWVSPDRRPFIDVSDGGAVPRAPEVRQVMADANLQDGSALLLS